MMTRLAHLAAGRTRMMLVAMLVLFLAGGAIGGPVVGLLSTSASSFRDSQSSSAKARALVEKATGASYDAGVVALVRPTGGANSTAGRARIEVIASRLRGSADVARVVTPAGAPQAGLVSTDGASALVLTTLKPESVVGVDAVKRVTDLIHGERDVQIGGPDVVGETIGKQVQSDIPRAEAIAFPILFIVSLLIFRGLIAALLPLLVGGLAITTTLLVMRGVNSGLSLSIFAVNLVTGLGLGLAIDYSLLILTRYRRERADGGDMAEVLGRTLRTAGRTVLFSGLTVSAAMASLTVFPQRFLYSMGIGGIIVGLVATFLALTLLPAMLAMIGDKIDWGQLRRRPEPVDGSGGWARLARWVMKRPATVAIAASAALLLAAAPFLAVNFLPASSQDLPTSAAVRKVDATIARDFPGSAVRPTTVILRAPKSSEQEIATYAVSLGALPRVARVSPPVFLGAGIWRVDVTGKAPAQTEADRQLVRDVRDVPAPAASEVAGFSAEFLDQQKSLGSHLPIAIVVLGLLTMFLIFLATGSVVLPVKTLIINLLTVGAALGIAKLVFQDGFLSGLLGFNSNDGMEATQPILLSAVAVALSTDYAVFLLTRIKEARDQGAGEREAIALGLERTARVVTAAAILFSIAIGAFATSEVVFIKLIGVGTAAAVLIDAFIVRPFLVPSLMALLGKWNWWAPAPLARIAGRLSPEVVD